MKNNRIVAIDFLRSLSIVVMIMANAAAYVLEKPHYLILRFIFSIAAPTFIFLSGYSFYISYQIKKTKKEKYVSGLLLFITAAFIDSAIWHIYPFCTFDVLYLIATGIIVNTLIADWHYNKKLLLIFALIIFYLIFLKIINYRFEITEIQITEKPSTVTSMFMNEIQIWKRFLFDGWFPVFPWLAFAIAGNVVAERTNSIINNKFFYSITSGFIIICGILLFIKFTPTQLERDDYLELFYPPNTFFVVSVTGLLIFSIVYSYRINSTQNRFLLAFCEMGKKSLLVYILHSAVISFFLSNKGPYTFTQFLGVCVIFISFCLIVVYLVKFLNQRKLLSFIPIPILKILGLK